MTPRVFRVDVCCPLTVTIGPRPTHGQPRLVRVVHTAAQCPDTDDTRRYATDITAAVIRHAYRIDPTTVRIRHYLDHIRT